MSKKTREKTGKSRIAEKPRSAAGAKRPATTPTLGRSGAAAKDREPAAKAEGPAKKTASPSRGLTEGDTLPPFILPRDGGGSVSLADFAGRKLAIFFYPRADTPGCTLEASDFSRLAPDFSASGTAVLGVSADPVKAQDKFRDKHRLTVPLASDEDHRLLVPLGVWGEKSMYGKTFMGVLRTTVLVGANGKIARIWRNVRVPGHAEQVLAAARVL